MFERADQIFSEAIEKFAAPSAVLAVGDRSGCLFKKAYGYSRYYPDSKAPDGVYPLGKYEGSVRATEDTLYDLASLSKLVATTFAALRSIEEGVICLSDTLSVLIKDRPVPDDKKNITVRQLMTHTSGMPSHFHIKDRLEKKGIHEYSSDAALDCLLETDLAYAPGTKVVYSCMGYILLGKILESLYGKPLDAIADELVFKPLGMNSTCYAPWKKKGFDPEKCAVTEYSTETKKYWCGVVHDENARFLEGISGNAGVFSDVNDLIIFADMLSNRGVHAGKPFISQSLFELAVSNLTPGMDEYRGLGFSLYDGGMFSTGDLMAPLSYGHTGFTGTSLFVDAKSGFYYVLLTNRVHFTRGCSDIFRARRLGINAAYASYQKESGTNAI